ncbi:MAG: hypothetical protein ACK4MS_10470 [Paracoccaceae bacterium]
MTGPRVLLALAFAILAPAATAAPQCGPHAVVVRHLGDKWAESRHGIGIAADGSVVEIYASAPGSWTLIVTNPHGLTCLIASGQGWDAVSDPFPAPGVPG